MRISDWSSDVCSSDLISAMILLGIPVWAALGNERIPRIATPDSVSRLILLPDNDRAGRLAVPLAMKAQAVRSEEHTSELQSLMRISYAVFCLKKKNTTLINTLNLTLSFTTLL